MTDHCSPTMARSPLFGRAFRLLPGEDLKQALQSITQQEKLKAATILTCVGSLSQTALRFANQSDWTVLSGKFEIVSLTGTLCEQGCHLHLSVSDETGNTIGGHVVDGNLVFTTAEIVLVELESLVFKRELDEQMGYRELVVGPRWRH